ncbi:MAG: hypothetical protein OEY95_07350 [Candidatus Bathyarchaeota archaeon]|nr:hypothetical protein [Candidatus Bathyarchaeota archaeon]MDH5754997.1 hypothetical protein [Candidatus Bathyarchaeota archaeon]
MVKVSKQIQEAIELCMKANRKPSLILINPEVLIKFKEEVGSDIETIFGIEYIEHPKIKDFFIVDDRSWTEQKF